MSANEQHDWSDSLDFESLADEQEGIEPAAPPPAAEEDFAAELAEPVEDEVAAPAEPAPPAPRRHHPRSSGVSGVGLGVLFAFSVLVAAAGSGGALLTALGVDPTSLWQPEGFAQLDRLLDLDRHPLNLIYIVSLATLLLTMLGAWAVARAVRRVGRQAVQDADLLNRVAALRIDEEAGWQDHELKSHPGLAAFVDENVGTWRLHEARQRRSLGLEGELQRLTRAATKDNREELTGRFDNPAVGSLADELVRLLDERESARREADAIRAKDREEAEALVKAVADAAGWNMSLTDQVGVQNAAAAGLESRLQELAGFLSADDESEAREDARRRVAKLRQELREAAEGAAGGAEDAASALHDLVERGTKLAFQIAMEVARLGPRGERLLPMTQSLEELTTSFREVSERLADPGEEAEEAHLRRDRELASLQDYFDGDDPGRDRIGRHLQDLVPVVNQLAGHLGALASGSDRQTERLQALGARCAALTGVSYEPTPTAAEPPAPVQEESDDLNLARFDPFGGDDEDGEERLATDPFDSGGADAPDPFAGDGDGPEEPAAPAPGIFADLAPAEVDLGWQDQPAASAPTPAPAEPTAPVAPVAPDTPVVSEEPVLDLEALGAVRVEDDPAPVPEETIHDLAEFGAVRLG